MMSDSSVAMTAVRMLLASLAVAVLPGLLIVLAWRPLREITLLELAALGIAVSMIGVQVLTIAAIVLHQPVEAMLAVLALTAVSGFMTRLSGHMASSRSSTRRTPPRSVPPSSRLSALPTSSATLACTRS